MLNHLMMDTLRQIAHGVAIQFGSNCEVVVHDLSTDRLDNSIIHIENGHVSKRKQGDGPSHIVLETIKQDPSKLNDKLAYLTKTHDGHILKSSTMYIRDENGVPSAIFAINYDITSFLAIEGSINSLIATNEDEGTASEPENIPLNVNDLLEELIAQSIKIVGKPPTLMSKDDKIKAIQFLNNSGAFLITKSGDKISKCFGISKYTLYSYMDAGKENA